MEWLNVEDDMPEYWSHVLVYLKDRGSCSIAYAQPKCLDDNVYWYEFITANELQVTHWMPLPNSPPQCSYTCMELDKCSCPCPYHSVFTTVSKEEAQAWVDASPTTRIMSAHKRG